MYEKFILPESVTSVVDKFPSEFISAYRGAYSINHFLSGLIEQWKGALDKNSFVGAVFMDLSKAFADFLMIYVLRNCMLMTIVKTSLRFSTPI